MFSVSLIRIGDRGFDPDLVEQVTDGNVAHLIAQAFCTGCVKIDVKPIGSEAMELINLHGGFELAMGGAAALGSFCWYCFLAELIRDTKVEYRGMRYCFFRTFVSFILGIAFAWLIRSTGTAENGSFLGEQGIYFGLFASFAIPGLLCQQFCLFVHKAGTKLLFERIERGFNRLVSSPDFDVLKTQAIHSLERIVAILVDPKEMKPRLVTVQNFLETAAHYIKQIRRWIDDVR